MVTIYGTITEYMGTAYTGHGISHKYDKLIETAEQVIFLKGAPTNALSPLLQDIASHFIKRGLYVDRFMNPIQPDKTDAVFIRGENLLILQASHPVAVEPIELGGRHKVVSFYDVYDERKLKELNKIVIESKAEAEDALHKTLSSLSDAKQIHDDWEAVNIVRMMWEEHEQVIESLKQELFGTMKLHKESAVAHRIIGSLAAGGAKDFIPSITYRTQRRILIKGLSGSGKSTLMKALGKEAERRGIDVLYGWCGLDPASVDLVLFPELSVCLFDATKPHEYEPELKGDEILDLLSLCTEDPEAEEKIAPIEEAYKEKILDASGYMHAYANAMREVKGSLDSAINQKVFTERATAVWELLPS
ncbi:hypothetical protein [Sporosarcina sp. Te-1]|uniref:hypothetical protein n=1 Tax=Sporosarcina sp. Te-1 TaxID=2818390 RepID=UPI001A9E1CB3|nr:hypothetical protein [Sporosarcina sp. Te-1]QTD40685.1 hypothetical protein J3U78_18285 [Sporosarcina sp. Te-1]